MNRYSILLVGPSPGKSDNGFADCVGDGVVSGVFVGAVDGAIEGETEGFGISTT